MNAHPPEKFPDPWLFDTNALIRELDRVRELVLAIPIHNDTYGPTNTAVATLWEFRERLRFMVGLQMERQRDWAKMHPAEFPSDAPVDGKAVRAFKKRQTDR
jgi:hypothetical protein